MPGTTPCPRDRQKTQFTPLIHYLYTYLTEHNLFDAGEFSPASQRRRRERRVLAAARPSSSASREHWPPVVWTCNSTWTTAPAGPRTRMLQCDHRLKVRCRALLRGGRTPDASALPSSGVERTFPHLTGVLPPSLEFCPLTSHASLIFTAQVKPAGDAPAALELASKKGHAGCPSGVLRCVACSKKKRPCGAACSPAMELSCSQRCCCPDFRSAGDDSERGGRDFGDGLLLVAPSRMRCASLTCSIKVFCAPRCTRASSKEPPPASCTRRPNWRDWQASRPIQKPIRVATYSYVSGTQGETIPTMGRDFDPNRPRTPSQLHPLKILTYQRPCSSRACRIGPRRRRPVPYAPQSERRPRGGRPRGETGRLRGSRS